MRLTFLAPSLSLTGGARVIHIYATALAKRGHEVTVITPARRVRSWRERFRAFRRGEPWRQPPRASTLYQASDYRIHVLDTHRPILASDVPPGDAVIATWFETAEWMLAMPPEAGAKVHFVQGYEAFTPETKPRVDAVLAAPTFKITISGWLDALLRDEYGNADVVTVPNGVDMGQFYASPRERNARFTVGLLYNRTPVKNAGLGLSIFARYAERDPQARLVCFGQYPEFPALKLPPQATLHVDPAQDSIREIYSQCDVWLCPSNSEGFHLPPLEAMACRCPVVSTPVGGPLDIIEEGVNGYLYPFNDADAAVERLASIAGSDAASWRRLSDGAHATALGSTWDAAAARFEHALVEAVGRDRRVQVS